MVILGTLNLTLLESPSIVSAASLSDEFSRLSSSLSSKLSKLDIVSLGMRVVVELERGCDLLLIELSAERRGEGMKGVSGL